MEKTAFLEASEFGLTNRSEWYKRQIRNKYQNFGRKT
jgi:hypothetical protein